MPNWVYNNLTINGNKDRLLKIREAVKGDQQMKGQFFDFDFFKIKEDGDFGVKWNACEVEAIDNLDLDDRDEYELSYSFNTAWGWPQPVLEAFCEKYPDVKLNYTATEESHAFAIHAWNDGAELDYHERMNEDFFHDDNKWEYIDNYFDSHEELNKDDYDLDRFFIALEDNGVSWEVDDYGFSYKYESTYGDGPYDNDFEDLHIRPYDEDEFTNLLEEYKL